LAGGCAAAIPIPISIAIWITPDHLLGCWGFWLFIEIEIAIGIAIDLFKNPQSGEGFGASFT